MKKGNFALQQSSHHSIIASPHYRIIALAHLAIWQIGISQKGKRKIRFTAIIALSHHRIEQLGK